MYNYNETAPAIKHFNNVSATIKQIREYTKQIRSNQVKCNLPSCRNCETSSKYFKRHQARQRQFYVISENIIRIILGLLIRWKCPVCGKTLTDYPEFAVPYKRYTVPTIRRYAGLYTENEQASYRIIIIKSSIGYPDSEKQLSHTTVHRWITGLGGFSKTLAKAQELYLQAKPQSGIIRELASISIPSEKYRTKYRKSIFQKCQHLLRMELEFFAIFRTSIFTRLATQSGYG